MFSKGTCFKGFLNTIPNYLLFFLIGEFTAAAAWHNSGKFLFCMLCVVICGYYRCLLKLNTDASISTTFCLIAQAGIFYTLGETSGSHSLMVERYFCVCMGGCWNLGEMRVSMVRSEGFGGAFFIISSGLVWRSKRLRERVVSLLVAEAKGTNWCYTLLRVPFGILRFCL